MRFEKKRLIIFDLDGTLVDSVPDLALAINDMLKSFGKSCFSEDIIRGWVGNGSLVLVKRALSGNREIDESLDEEFISLAHKRFLDYYAKILTLKTKAYDGVVEVINQLYYLRYTLAIVSNKPYRFIEPILKSIGLDAKFSLILGGDSLSSKKPSPKPLLHCLKELNIESKDAVMVGDSKNDIISAKKAKIDTIALSYGYNYDEDIREYNPTVVLDNFKELRELFTPYKVAIVGGGVSGATLSMILDRVKIKNSLFEKRESLISGPPFCHLHSGGNLYPDIPDSECLKLLEQSIEFARFYPDSIDYRPTILAFPKRAPYEPSEYLNRLKKLQKRYKELVEADSKNRVLGEVEEYFFEFSKETLQEFSKEPLVDEPKTPKDWMVNFANYVDLDKLKFPVFLVAEYGLNLFRVSAIANLSLESAKYSTLKLNHKVKDIKRVVGGFLVDGEFFDYLINSAGFESGIVDDMLGFKRDRFVEFKSAYVTKWQNLGKKLPEIIFHGKRGSSEAMGQFSPYSGDFVQLHSMTKDITLFKDGLAKSTKDSSYPRLPKRLIDILENGWERDFAIERTKRAIDYLSFFIPSFSSATATSTPLYGAQQIPGDNPELRAFEGSFEDRYARSEIVKVSSIIDLARAILKELQRLNIAKKEEFSIDSERINQKELEQKAKKIAKKRDYPEEMGELLIKDYNPNLSL